MTLPAPEAIIFDWDNTLVDTWPIIHAALNATLAHTGKPLWTFDMTRERVRKSMRDSFPEIFGENWQEAGAFYQAQYRANHLLKLQALPHAETVLKAIAKTNVYCVVVSNKKGENLRKEVTHLGWDSYFHQVVGADDAPRDKPYADPVLLAFKDSRTSPSAKTWFIGDSDIDLECAVNTGCTSVLYGDVARASAHFTPTHFGGQPYHHFVNDHMALLELFQRFSQ